VRGRRTSVTDQNGKQTTYAYDDADRLISVTDAAQHVTSYAYDDENNLSTITDANTHATSFVYDNLGRVKETDFPSGHAETYIYDVIGNLTSEDRPQRQHDYVCVRRAEPADAQRLSGLDGRGLRLRPGGQDQAGRPIRRAATASPTTTWAA